jgi:hypothetical protein
MDAPKRWPVLATHAMKRSSLYSGADSLKFQMYKLADRDVDHPGMLITHKSQHSHTKHVFIFLT